MAMERKRSSRRSNHRYPSRKASPAARCKNCCRKFTAFMFSHVGLCALVVGYAIMGAFAFVALESGREQQNAVNVKRKREEVVTRLWDITNELNILYKENWTRRVADEIRNFTQDVINAVKDGYDGSEAGSNQQWSLPGAFLYSLTVITTIGYGNIAPKTAEGKIVTIVYAIMGIPLMLLYLTNIGDILARMFKYVYARVCQCTGRGRTRASGGGPPARPTENYRAHHIVAQNSPNKQNAVTTVDPTCKDKLRVPVEDEVHIETIPGAVLEEEEYGEKPQVTVPISLCLLILVAYICGGGVLFAEWEGWSFLDGTYFCFVTLTTIGFGDLVPGDSTISDEGAQGKLVLCALYLLVGMALIAMCFNLMQEEVIHKVRACGARIGIIRDHEEEDD